MMDAENEKWLQDVEDGIEPVLRRFDAVTTDVRKNLAAINAWAQACRLRPRLLSLDREAIKQFEIVANRLEMKAKKLQRELTKPVTKAEIEAAFGELDRF